MPDAIFNPNQGLPGLEPWVDPHSALTVTGVGHGNTPTGRSIAYLSTASPREWAITPTYPRESLADYSVPATSILMKFACLLACLIVNTLAAETRPPNVIFFLVDDYGQRDVGCYGSKFYETPAIDQLAIEGMRFDNAYSTCHVCSPSRASILTGKYPARTKLTEWLAGRPEMEYEKLHHGEKVTALPVALLLYLTKSHKHDQYEKQRHLIR